MNRINENLYLYSSKVFIYGVTVLSISIITAYLIWIVSNLIMMISYFGFAILGILMFFYSINKDNKILI